MAYLLGQPVKTDADASGLSVVSVRLFSAYFGGFNATPPRPTTGQLWPRIKRNG